MAITLPLQGALPEWQVKLAVLTLAVKVAGSAIKKVVVTAQFDASLTVSVWVP